METDNDTRVARTSILTPQDKCRRTHWIEIIGSIGGNFGVDTDRVRQKIREEIELDGSASLLCHLRLCGAIPEGYDRDSSEEKLYAKYTDYVIHTAYETIGLSSSVNAGRADTADVECVGDNYSFVADAKAFRMSRTAKNQKDFKVQAMDTWKHGKPFAMIVCPMYQLPSRRSQIYEQATTLSVCIFTYTHLAVLVRVSELIGRPAAQGLLHCVFKTVKEMISSQDAGMYWQTVNRAFLRVNGHIGEIWREEKIAAVESIDVARDEALCILARERERIMRLSKGDAIAEVLKWRRIGNRKQTVKSVADKGLLNFE